MKKTLFPAFIVLAVLLLSGCGARQEKLKVAMSLTEDEWKVMREKVIPAFEKKEKIAVEAVQVEASDLPQLLEAMDRAGSMQIDLFAQDNMQLALLTSKNLVEDLSTYEKMIPRSVPGALVSNLRTGDRLYFMPYRPNVQITYYNKEKFDKYGLKPPRNWDELLAVAKKFKQKEKTGKVLFQAWGGSPTATQLYEWIVSAGGDPFKFNDRGCVRTFTFLQKLWPYMSPDSRRAKFDTTNEYLARESAYLAQNWPFGVRVLVKDFGKKNIRTYSGFRGPRRYAHVIGGEVLGIPKGTRKKQQALLFIKHLQSKEIQETLVSELGWPSIRTDAYAQVEPWMKPHYDSVMKAMRAGVFRKNVPYWNQYEKLANEAFIKIVVRGEPVKQTLNAYAKQMAEHIKK
jgi:trehalose transport system substrate-binding protein